MAVNPPLACFRATQRAHNEHFEACEARSWQVGNFAPDIEHRDRRAAGQQRRLIGRRDAIQQPPTCKSMKVYKLGAGTLDRCAARLHGLAHQD